MENAITVSTADLDYFLKQRKTDLDIIIVNMTALLSDIDGKYEAMKNQNWFKRIWKTISGQNKATVESIKKNQAQLSAYCAKVLTELLKRQKISENLITNLGSQINNLYENHIELRKALSSFAVIINEKIDSVDNYFMLCQDIELNKFSGNTPTELYRIMSRFDRRMLNDHHKMSNIKDLLVRKNILSNDKIQIGEYLLMLCDTQTDEAAMVYMEASLHTNCIVAGLVTEVFENYVFLSSSNKQFILKEDVVNDALIRRRINGNTEFSLSDDFDRFIEDKQHALALHTSVLKNTESTSNKGQPLLPVDTENEYISETSDVDIRKDKNVIKGKGGVKKAEESKRKGKTTKKDDTPKVLLGLGIFMISIFAILIFMWLYQDGVFSNRVSVSANIVIEFLDADSEAAEISIGSTYIGTQTPGTIRRYTALLPEGSTSIEFTVGDRTENRSFTISETNEYHYFTFERKRGLFRPSFTITYNGLITSAEASEMTSG